MSKELTDFLSDFVTEERKNLFEKIIEYRTRYITVVLEDIYQSHNASAVLRTCDCFGIQDVHIIENKNTYSINPNVALGSFKWLSMIKHNQKENNTLSAIKEFKNKGYRIVATTPHTNDLNLEEFDLKKGKVALFFGTELTGLTNNVIDNADEYLKIPMFGFTESFNISVSAAIILHYLTLRLKNSTIDWRLSQEEMEEIKINWLRNSINKSEMLEKEFLSRKKNKNIG